MTNTATEAQRLTSTVGYLASLLKHGGGTLTTGDIAALRRMDPRAPASAFFKLESYFPEGALPSALEALPIAETRWAAIVVGLAHLGDLHRPDVPLGAALANAGFSEIRFTRLLRADGERLVDEIPALGRFLAAKGVAANFTDAARLLVSADRSDEETSRRRLARRYYAATQQQKNAND